jgi:hypothetical protein
MTSEMRFQVKLHSSNLEPLMSTLGQKQTFTHLPKADIG